MIQVHLFTFAVQAGHLSILENKIQQNKEMECPVLSSPRLKLLLRPTYIVWIPHLNSVLLVVWVFFKKKIISLCFHNVPGFFQLVFFLSLKSMYF